MKREIWRNPSYKHDYFQLVTKDKFALCQVNGSLSSIKVYESEEEARAEGWKLEGEE